MKSPDTILVSVPSFQIKDEVFVRKNTILKWVKEQEEKLEYGISADAFQLALTMLKEKLESL